MHRISIRGISTFTAVAVAAATLGITTDAFGSPERPMVVSTPVSPLVAEQATLLKAEAMKDRAQAVHDQHVAALKAAKKKRAAKHAAAKKRAAARVAAQRKAAAARASRYARAVRPGSNRALGRDMAADRGWGATQFVCLDQLWSRESGWSQNASNSSGAYGIPQALPASKMSSAGADWATNPRTQIAWGLSYIAGRYGSACGAWSSFQARGYY